MSASTASMVPVVMAALFAVFTGFNDAGVLVGVGVNGRGLPPLAALATLTAAVVGGPLLLGTAVAATLSTRLVPGSGTATGGAGGTGPGGARGPGLSGGAGGPGLSGGAGLGDGPGLSGGAGLGDGPGLSGGAGLAGGAETGAGLIGGPESGAETGLRVAVLAGIAAAVVVTVVLSARRLPTSLTLALIGGISGAGLGGGLAAHTGSSVNWAVVLAVLAAAALAPVVGAFGALAAGRVLAAMPTPGERGAGNRLRWLHLGGFAAACIAYGANDGQKMLAVYAVAVGGSPAYLASSPPALILIALCFLAGGLLGVHRIGAAGGGLAATRPDGVVVTELSSAGVVLGTAALGAPVSMTQSMSGALVGAALSGGKRRVRWRKVTQLGRAWMVTLPAAFTAGALAAAALVAVPRL